MEETPVLYVRGFNHGYTLAKYEPVLFSQITKKLKPTSDYLAGFFSGEQEYEMEKAHAILKDLDKLRSRSNDREQDLDRDI